MQPAARENRPLVLWLLIICALIIAMVVIGGITRLTHSGLSMVEWRPISGAIPPLTESDWQDVFARYQQFPEYRELNRGMTLVEFKFIFFWEYLHRLLGRLIGVAFLLPALFFWWTGRLNRKLGGQLFVGFILGGLQGALGWFMVKSGLVDDPHVSHFRLAAHLGLALGVLAYLFWIVLDLSLAEEKGPREAERLRMPLACLSGAIVLQIFYGAFTAGLRAGFGFNTFPKMNDEWFPTGFFWMDSWLRDIFENPIAVQFLHRAIGWVVLLLAVLVAYLARDMSLSARQRLALRGFFAMTLIQFLLGVATILLVVPVSIATLHQFGACLLILFAVFANRAFASTK